ncbi:FAD-dependent oxidoreductase [Nocardiopsis oceani]
MGGIRTAQALRSAGFQGDVTVVGAEREAPYDKPPLSKQVLTGEQTRSDIALLGESGWAGERIEAHLGHAATNLDTTRRRVHLDNGEEIPYDALVIATGVRARTLGPQDTQLVHTVRELQDATALRERIARKGPVVIVGGGFIGAEVASAARRIDNDVTIVESLATPFAHVLGPRVGGLLSGIHQEAGVSIVTGAAVSAIEQLPDDTGVLHLSDGRRLHAGTVVVGIGSIPNDDWLAQSNLRLDRGVITDEFCAAHGAEGVYAIGDVARWYDVHTGQHRRVEHWTSAVEQAHLVAHNIMDPGNQRPHTKAPYFWSDQHGTKIQMVGQASPQDHVELLRCRTTAGERNIALYSRDKWFSAAVAFGWPRAVIPCRQAWEGGAPVADVRQRIQALATEVTPLDTTSPV